LGCSTLGCIASGVTGLPSGSDAASISKYSRSVKALRNMRIINHRRNQKSIERRLEHTKSVWRIDEY
jgi:hypothetical protein